MRSQKTRTANIQLFADSNRRFHPSTCVTYLTYVSGF